jgi:hypothetical protein
VTGDPAGPYRTLDSFDELTTSPFSGCNSLDGLFVRAVQLHGSADCLGTRELLNEEDEMQPNGKVFRKVSMMYSVMCNIVYRARQMVTQCHQNMSSAANSFFFNSSVQSLIQF